MTQSVLRQRWSSVIPSGIGPTRSSYAMRCACVDFPRRHPPDREPNWPYPFDCCEAVQIQHPDGSSRTFAQKRSCHCSSDGTNPTSVAVAGQLVEPLERRVDSRVTVGIADMLRVRVSRFIDMAELDGDITIICALVK